VRRALLPLAAAALLAGCGNARTPVPDISVIPAPKGFAPEIFTKQGVRFRKPQNWRSVPGVGIQLATVAIGDAQVGVWRYPRSEPLPETRDQLAAARKALLAQVKNRDPSFKLKRSRLILKPTLRAVEIVGVGTNLANPRIRRSVRSLHAYGYGGEVVMDAFAPSDQFARVDKQTFAPMERSLRLSAPAKS
jgi:hypothetical protein